MTSFIEILSSYLDEHPEWNEASLATAAGLNNSAVRQMLKFRRNPRIDTIQKICAALGETVESFMARGSGIETPEIQRLFALLTPEEQAMIKTTVTALVAQRRGAAP